jgi:hypothetical protein
MFPTRMILLQDDIFLFTATWQHTENTLKIQKLYDDTEYIVLENSLFYFLYTNVFL